MSHEAVSVRRYERLSRLRDFEVASREPDPRGWPIVNVANERIGEVRDLIVDTDSMTARYLDVELEPGAFHVPEEDARILVPIERAHRVGDHHRLRIEGLTRNSVAAIVAAREESYMSFWNHWWASDRPEVTHG